MIIADTSALISLATVSVFDTVCAEFDIHTTSVVVAELEETAEFDDPHGTAATRVRGALDAVTIHDISGEMRSSRIDPGESSCLALDRETCAEFLITDDVRALPELRTLSDAQVALSPIVLRALCKRGVVSNEEAIELVDRLAETRGWLDAPIYRRARDLFDTD
jgi:predicted nucleic acid-binding protein